MSYGECPLHMYRQRHKNKRKKVAKWCTSLSCVGSVGQTLNYTIGKPPRVLFFYPWLKTEKIVSWRQMRLTAGTEWKVSFNLSLRYNLSGLIKAKHPSFHHREDVVLIHFNKGVIWNAWLWGWFAQMLFKFKM